MPFQKTLNIQIDEDTPSNDSNDKNDVEVQECGQRDGFSRQNCDDTVEIKSSKSQNALKCENCQEGEVISKSNSDEIKFVRCPCKCVLAFRQPSEKVINSPMRQFQSKGVITEDTNINHSKSNNSNVRDANQLGDSGDRQQKQIVICDYCGGCLKVSISELLKVTCAFCHAAFVVHNLTSSSLALCPYCKKVSSLSEEYVRIRKLGYLGLSVFLLLLIICFTVATYGYYHKNKGLLASYTALFIFDFVIFIISITYFRLKVSKAESFRSQQS